MSVAVSSDWKNLNFGTTLNGLRNVVIKRVLSPYAKYRIFLEQSQWWPLTRLRAYQEEQLRQVMNIAYHYTPFYRGLMEIFDLRPESIRCIEDIERFPMISKEDVRENHRKMVSDKKLMSALYKCHTSGTTGKPLTLYRDLDNVGFEQAILMRQWAWAGLTDRDRCATLKGDIVPRQGAEKGRFWIFNPAENKLMMSSYHLSEEHADRYVDALAKYGIRAIDGYPSSVYALARFILERGRKFPLKAVLTSSETLVPEQKQIIQKAFDCQVFDYYGMAERVAAIHTCEYGRYHLIPEYSLVEFIERDYLSDGYYEIVGTSFVNKAMPLIRYQIGDIVKPDDGECACGRAYPLIESIVGRRDDYIVTPSGKLIGRLDHIFKGARNLVEAQLYQPDTRHIILRIVPDKSYDELRDGQHILNQLQQRLGEPMNFEIESVSSIPRNGRGKFKAVVSEVNAFTNQ